MIRPLGRAGLQRVGPSVNRILQLQPGEQWPQWTIYFLLIGGIGFVAAMLILVPFSWWKVVWKKLIGLPNWIRRACLWRLYGPEYVISKPAISQKTANTGSEYTATVRLSIVNRDKYPLRVDFYRAEINIKQRFGRTERRCRLAAPVTGTLPQDVVPAHESRSYQISLDGTYNGAAYPNLKDDYQYGMQGIFVFLSEIGERELHKGIYYKSTRVQTVRAF
jgi:hypothetical protein